jgi:hypothetical protein
VRERLGAARREVNRACAFLVKGSPAALERSAGALESAASVLAALKAEETGMDSEARKEVLALCGALKMARTLIASAAAYHDRWLRVAGAMASGYTAAGEAAPLVRRGSLSVCG